jgi:mannose-6-phosphate isomerase-like protein (cupin superfamily)
LRHGNVVSIVLSRRMGHIGECALSDKPWFKEVIMLSKRNTIILGSVICLSFIFLVLTNICRAQSQSLAQDAYPQILTQIDEILNKNPLRADEKSQLIKIAEDNTITLSVGRSIDGAGLKPHIHKTHDETVYVVRGSGQIFVNDKWVDVKPGTVHFNPMGKVHGSRSTGTEPYVIISIFTPALKEADRYFVE